MSFIDIFAWLMTVMRHCSKTVLNALYEYVCLTFKIAKQVYFLFFISTSTKRLEFFHDPDQSSVKNIFYSMKQLYRSVKLNQPICWFCLTCWLHLPISQFFLLFSLFLTSSLLWSSVFFREFPFFLSLNCTHKFLSYDTWHLTWKQTVWIYWSNIFHILVSSLKSNSHVDFA